MSMPDEKESKTSLGTLSKLSLQCVPLLLERVNAALALLPRDVYSVLMFEPTQKHRLGISKPF